MLILYLCHMLVHTSQAAQHAHYQSIQSQMQTSIVFPPFNLKIFAQNNIGFQIQGSALNYCFASRYDKRNLLIALSPLRTNFIYNLIINKTCPKKIILLFFNKKAYLLRRLLLIWFFYFSSPTKLKTSYLISRLITFTV